MSLLHFSSEDDGSKALIISGCSIDREMQHPSTRKRNKKALIRYLSGGREAAVSLR